MARQQVERRKSMLLNLPVSKTPATEALDEAQVSRIIEMAWEDRTPFEAIAYQFGLNQDSVIKLMRARLKHSSFKLWRARTHGQTTKHLKLRSSAVTRHKANHRVKQF